MFQSWKGMVTMHAMVVLMPVGHYLKSLHDDISCDERIKSKKLYLILEEASA